MAKKRSHSPLHQPYSSSEIEKAVEEASKGELVVVDHLPPNPKLQYKSNQAQTQAQPQSSLSPTTDPANKKMKKSTDKNCSPSNANEQEEDLSPNLNPTDHNSETQAQAHAQTILTLRRRSGRKRATKKSTLEDFTEEDKDEKTKSEKQFERIWSEEDEITILEGLVDFTSETTNKGKDISIVKFYKGKKKSLRLNATYTQVRHKVRKLREKYQINVEKLNNGVKCNFIFSKLHHCKLFYLSHKVWRNSIDKSTLEHTLELFRELKKEELEWKWKKLQIEEITLFVKRWKMIKELSELILEAYNNSIAN